MSTKKNLMRGDYGTVVHLFRLDYVIINQRLLKAVIHL
jgi:hypothetical protein